MNRKLWPVALAAAALTATALAAVGTQAAQAEVAIPASGTATGTLNGLVDVSALSASPQALLSAQTVSTEDVGMLTIDGTLQSQPNGASTGTKSPDSSSTATVEDANFDGTVNSFKNTPHAPGVVRTNFDGIDQYTSNCNQCSPSDGNAAVGTTQIAEVTNARLQVYDKTGVLQCGTSLYPYFGVDPATGDRVVDPRVQYDNLNHRYLLSASRMPFANTAPPVVFLGASTADNACGTWWVYTVGLSGGYFMPGTRIDFPGLGQDYQAVLSSANYYSYDFEYTASGVWSVPKSAVYSGAGFSVPIFDTSFSAQPMVAAGIPMPATTYAYYLATVPGVGYNLYRMANTAGPGTTLTLQATISAPFSAPVRRVNQPGTTITLDPGDGRMTQSPVLHGDFLWFAHGIDQSGFPSVRYGAIGLLDNSATVATMFHSATSDDFDPSIGIADAGHNKVRIWVNWAYTDTPNNVPTTVTVNGVGPNERVPSKVGGLDLVTGITTNGNRRYGDYSSVSIDPVGASSSCPAGNIGVLAQSYFRDVGIWQDRIATVGFC